MVTLEPATSRKAESTSDANLVEFVQLLPRQRPLSSRAEYPRVVLYFHLQTARFSDTVDERVKRF